MQNISFQLRQKLLITGFIIVVILLFWLFISLFSMIFTDPSPTPLPKKSIDYIEKIDNFALQEFNHKHILSRLIEARSYFNFKQKPDLLLEPKISVYNQKGKADYVLRAKLANYLANGEIKFQDEVSISSKSGAVIETKSLTIDQSGGQDIYQTEDTVHYKSRGLKIRAEGMRYDLQNKKIKLTGGVVAQYE